MALKKFLMIGVVAGLLVACGDEASDKSPVQVAEESSSSVDEVLSSSVNVEESSSSVESEGLSSSVEYGASSSSEKSTESSSGKNTEPAEVSSCSVAEESSSSTTVEQSSSSVKIEQSSSSEKAEASSSSVKVQESSSSVKVEESSSSAKTDASSSSEKPAESSSSEKVAESSSSEKPVESSSSAMSIYDAENNTLTDLRDNQIYKTVTIGEQVWMAENLNYMPEDTAGTIYSGGTVCGGGAQNSKEDSEKCDIFGRLYLRKVALNKTTASNRQGICPDGWSIPKKEDWEILMEFVVNDASKLKSVNAGWSNEATNESGFSAIPTGNYNNVSGYDGSSWATYFFYWHTGASSYFLRINDYNPDVYYSNKTLYFSSGADYMMYPVRCKKNSISGV